jgi:hypothetical protein
VAVRQKALAHLAIGAWQHERGRQLRRPCSYLRKVEAVINSSGPYAKINHAKPAATVQTQIAVRRRNNLSMLGKPERAHLVQFQLNPMAAARR